MEDDEAPIETNDDEADEQDAAEIAAEKGIRAMARAVRGRLRRNKDALILVTGEEGEGKSTFAIQLARLIDKEFALKRNVLFDPSIEQLHALMYGLPKESAVLVDELIRIGYSRNWFSAENKFLNELMVLCRKQRKATIMCIPRFGMTDSDVKRRALFWVHVVAQGVGIVMRKDKNQFSLDPWNVRENNLLLRDRLKGRPVHDFSVSDYANAISASPNFVGIVRFDKLPEDMESEYDLLAQPFALKTPKDEDAPNSRIMIYKRGAGSCAAELLKIGWSLGKICNASGLGRAALNECLKAAGADVPSIRQTVAIARAGKGLPEQFDEVEVNI